MDQIEERIREIVKEELATALKEKITLQIQYTDSQESNSATTNENETTEDINNQVVQENNTSQEAAGEENQVIQ